MSDAGPLDGKTVRLINAVTEAARSFVDEIEREQRPPLAKSLSMAMLSGLDARLTYTVSECGKFTGLGEGKIRRDHEKGLLDFIEPDGERGARIGVIELDRYLKDLGVLQ